MFVLGIDPGVSRCGYGAVRREGSGLVVGACGVIRTATGSALADRLVALERELQEVVDTIRPTAVAVERVFFQVNVRTAMSVGQASGVALLVAARAGIPVRFAVPAGATTATIRVLRTRGRRRTVLGTQVVRVRRGLNRVVLNGKALRRKLARGRVTVEVRLRRASGRAGAPKRTVVRIV